MSIITREQAKDLRNAFQCWQQDYDPVEDKEQYYMFGLGMVAMDALLASLEPVSVIKIDHESSLIKHVKRVVSETNAPPAPVSVPDAMEMDDDFDSAFEHGKAVGWNACRAAILQGAEPVQGWIPCSDRMPTKNDRVLIFINFNSDTVPPSIHDAQFTGSTFRRGNATVNVFPLEDGYGVTHWMPLPAAPQQEA
ncbi:MULTISPECIES: DUF551 domain-containing protein [Enterobacter cloacae complex]|uniref:DUF551 domain-containing protein n=1 Tax=Enterobacter cloacae complex TaxID=354276 RepID=UPI0021D2B058|nr:DUF551 domain-containing protein [Enterobacter cloacae]